MPRVPRPSTPVLNIPHPMGPTSPPQTPTTASPVSNRRKGPNGPNGWARARKPPQTAPGRRPSLPHRRPVGPPPGHGLKGSIRPDQLSPRSSESSSDADDDDDDDDDDESDSGSSDSGTPPRSLMSEQSVELSVEPSVEPSVEQSDDQSDEQSDDDSDGRPEDPSDDPSDGQSDDQSDGPASATLLEISTTIVVEEISDYDSDDSRLQVIRPHAIEDAESERSRSRTRKAAELDRGMLYGLRDLHCSDESDDSDESDLDEDESTKFRMKEREKRKIRRMTSGSIGKRNFSESIGSASDREDMGAPLDTNEWGPSDRRLRRKVDRWSLQFTDPPPPRIDELDEPETSDEDMIEVNEVLAKELPYYTLEYISMEVDSP